MSDAPYRSRELVADLVKALKETSEGLPQIRIMHVCGTHEHEIGRYALRQLFPANIKLVAGPGCPVCITPASTIATAIKLATMDPTPILCTYGDVVRIPISGGSIIETKACGADIRIIYGIRDALRIARENPDKNVIFFSVGFETTAAPVASLIASGIPQNLFIYCCHRYVPAAVEALAAADNNGIHGYLLPGHASVITGYQAYNYLPARFGKPAAVAGFEPVDILAGVVSIVRQIKQKRPAVANCYPRVVSAAGNVRALQTMEKVFERVDANWRGIGSLPRTGLALSDTYRKHDALAHFGMKEEPAEDILPGCSCHLIMTARREPRDCALFGSACTPENPRGPCMVGGEGTCRAHYMYPEREDA